MKQAHSYATKACDLGVLSACVNLGIMYRRGEGCDADERLAKKFENVAKDIHKQMRGESPEVKFG